MPAEVMAYMGRCVMQAACMLQVASYAFTFPDDADPEKQVRMLQAAPFHAGHLKGVSRCIGSAVTHGAP